MCEGFAEETLHKNAFAANNREHNCEEKSQGRADYNDNREMQQ